MMKRDSYTVFYLVGWFLLGCTIHTMLGLLMSPVVAGVLVVAIAVPFSIYAFESN